MTWALVYFPWLNIYLESEILNLYIYFPSSEKKCFSNRITKWICGFVASLNFVCDLNPPRRHSVCHSRPDAERTLDTRETSPIPLARVHPSIHPMHKLYFCPALLHNDTNTVERVSPSLLCIYWGSTHTHTLTKTPILFTHLIYTKIPSSLTLAPYTVSWSCFPVCSS